MSGELVNSFLLVDAEVNLRAGELSGDAEFWRRVGQLLGHHWFEAATKRAIDSAVLKECDARIRTAKKYNYTKIDPIEAMALLALREAAQMRLDADEGVRAKQ